LGKVVSSLIMVLLFFSLFLFAYSVQPAKAQSGTIYINPDGGIEPPTAPISTFDNVTYTFVGDAFGGLCVKRDNIIIDGANCTLHASGYVSGWPTGVFLSEVTNVTIRYLRIETVTEGIYVSSSSGNRLFGNVITSNESGTKPILFGIVLLNSSNNSVYENNITLSAIPTPENSLGICVDSSNYNMISANMIENTFEAIALQDSAWNNVSGNTVRGNYYGIGVVGASNNIISENTITSGRTGIDLERCLNNVLSGNNVTENNDSGIVLYPGALKNTLCENYIANNERGITLWQASENSVYHNSFVNNSQQVDILESGYNLWDNGYPAGGNYWSNYNGTDFYSGPYQNVSGSDGIGDNVYVLGSENADHYPLLPPEKMRDLMIEKYNELSLLYQSLNSTHNDLLSELNWTRNIAYILILTTTTFAATTIYLAVRKTKTNRSQ